MDSNFEYRVVEKSQLVKATLSFQWIYALFGLTLPPTLCQTNGLKSCKLFILWLLYILYLVILFIMVLWIVYINNFMVGLVVANYALDSITSVLSIIQNCAVAFVELVMHLSAIRGRPYLIKIHQNIAQLERDILLYSRDCKGRDDLVEGKMRFSQRCSSFRRRLTLGLGLSFLSLSLLLSCVNFPLVSEYMTYRDRCLTVFCFQLIQTKCSEYCVFMKVVDELISTLELSLLHLKYDIIHLQRQQRVGHLHHQCYGKLMANQFLLGRIWCLVQHIEDYFAVPMLVLFLYNGVAITHTMNWQYMTSFLHKDNDTYESLVRLCFIFLVFINMLWACWLSQTCIDKYNGIGSILHSLKTNTYDLALRQRLREYSLQLMHQKLLFTCSGYFDINLKYFGLLTLAIMTYVVILIQFKLQEETEKANIRL